MTDKQENLSPQPTIHLVCNAHIDPVWLWEWEEGAAVALSTFRTAADLCEEFDGFIFNHNEAILYRWVEEYEPELFKRIQRLVKEGKWHIMGGWYLQPDCNMPSGESFVRQILLGRRYFEEKFGAIPTTALNFDPFGHTRGLVQIMVKSGYNAYLFCRPGQPECPLEQDEFIWEGYDGSRLLATRPYGGYGSVLGKVMERVNMFLSSRPIDADAILLWGVGNHGGGPSRKDLQDLAELIRTHQQPLFTHSTPEAYFEALDQRRESLPVHRKDLNPWAVGCYTSQVRIKQNHRRLENELYAAEKMTCAAWSQGLMDYPVEDFNSVMRDLATIEFHDSLPGSSIKPVEEMALRIIDHGLETLSRLRARAFYALTQGQPAAKENEIPILVYNPHPFPVQAIVECEFNLPDFNRTPTFSLATAYQGEQALPSQMEKELSSLNMDWRKRVVFSAELAPSQMNRFDCRLEVVSTRPKPEIQPQDGMIRFKTSELEAWINTHTGLLDRFCVNGVDYLEANACCPLVILDDPDPWGMRVHSFRNQIGVFQLLSPKDNLRFSGVQNPALEAVRVIEDGAVRTVVEAVMGYGDSFLCLRYKLPKRGTEVEVELIVYWNEKDRMLKLSLPTPYKEDGPRFLGQVAYGVAPLPMNGDEAVAQKWVAVVSDSADGALGVINDGSYGCDFRYGELRLTLLRSAGYSVHPINERPLQPDDRFAARMEQGERTFRFWLNAGPVAACLEAIDRQALLHNEKPMAISFYPQGGGENVLPFITLSDTVVQVSAAKKAEAGDELILRLFEPTGQARATTVSLPFAGMEKEVNLQGFEIRSLLVNLQKRTWREVNLVEKAV